MSDKYRVHFPQGYTAHVVADSEPEAKRLALEQLVQRGYSINPKTDVNAEKNIAVVKET
jgi:hypothetical protein